MMLITLIENLEDRSKSYMKHYKDTGEVQSQGIALGLDEAVAQLKIYLEDD